MVEFAKRTEKRSAGLLQEEILKDGGPKLPPLITTKQAKKAFLPLEMTQNFICDRLIIEKKQPQLLSQVIEFHDYRLHHAIEMNVSERYKENRVIQ